MAADVFGSWPGPTRAGESDAVPPPNSVGFFMPPGQYWLIQLFRHSKTETAFGISQLTAFTFNYFLRQQQLSLVLPRESQLPPAFEKGPCGRPAETPKLSKDFQDEQNNVFRSSRGFSGTTLP